jgi:hypothetical protein
MEKSTLVRDQDKFMLRLPEGVRERIADAARANNRSMNAEIVARLEETLSHGVVGRLRSVLRWINQERPYTHLSPSVIAEGIGEPNAAYLEHVFNNNAEPTFDVLDGIANYLGIRPDWLKHGNGHPFPTESERHYGLGLADRIISFSASSICLIRSDNENGNVAITIQLDDIKYITLTTTMHMSNNIGAGGMVDLANFSNACRKLWRDIKTKVINIQLDSNAFKQLTMGDIYPKTAIKMGSNAEYFREWWDWSMFTKQGAYEYWPGYSELCRSVYALVDGNKILRSERDRIMSGEL